MVGSVGLAPFGMGHCILSVAGWGVENSQRPGHLAESWLIVSAEARVGCGSSAVDVVIVVAGGPFVAGGCSGGTLPFCFLRSCCSGSCYSDGGCCCPDGCCCFSSIVVVVVVFAVPKYW